MVYDMESTAEETSVSNHGFSLYICWILIVHITVENKSNCLHWFYVRTATVGTILRQFY
jgi:hypothetical protein